VPDHYAQDIRRSLQTADRQGLHAQGLRHRSHRDRRLGMISVDAPLEILPRGITTRVRGLHSHGKSIPKAYAGQRVAINLQGVEKEDLRRGDVAVAPSSFVPTKTLDLSLDLLKDVPPLKNRSLVHFYTGTSETVARVILYEHEELKAGEHCFCQFRLQDPVIAMAGDRYIIRRFSPLQTLGGGEILDPAPGRRRRKDGILDLTIYQTGQLDQKIGLKIEKSGLTGISVPFLSGWINADRPALQQRSRHWSSQVRSSGMKTSSPCSCV